MKYIKILNMIKSLSHVCLVFGLGMSLLMATESSELIYSYQITSAKGLSSASDIKLRKFISQKAQRFSMSLKPTDGKFWDMSKVSVFGLEINNTGSKDIHFDLCLKNENATTWSNSSLGSSVVLSGEKTEIAVVLYRDAKQDHPAYRRMVGTPDGVRRHWHFIDAEHVSELVLSTAKSDLVSFSMGRLFALEKIRPSAYAPFIDRYGQFVQRQWDGKVQTEGDFQQNLKEEAELHRSMSSVGASSENIELNPYGGWLNGPKFKATGRFHTQQWNGRWYFVDPEGCLFWSFGVNCVGVDWAGQTPVREGLDVMLELPSTKDPIFGDFYEWNRVEMKDHTAKDILHYRFTKSNLYRKYGAQWKSKNLNQCVKRLKVLGLNTVGAWSDNSVIEKRSTPYTAIFHYEYAFAASKLPDPFDPITRKGLRKAIASYPVNIKDDPWCLGAFVNNELHWGNSNRDLVMSIMAYSASSQAKVVFVEELKKTYQDLGALNKAWKSSFSTWKALQMSQNRQDFTGMNVHDARHLAQMFAEKYFRMVDEELHRFDSNLLYLGSRYNAGGPEVIKAAGRYVDVISANMYNYHAGTGSYGLTDKPVLVSEFHFANTGDRNLGGGLKAAHNGMQQARLFKSYMREAIEDPKIIGAHWFQWRDQSVGGRYDGENYQVGLMDITDQPHPTLFRAFRDVSSLIYCGKK